MDVTPNATASRATWVEIRFLRIYKTNVNDQQPTAYLFNNTRQQCVVNVIFTAHDASGNPVSLSDAEARRAVRLIDYNSGVPLTHGDDFTAHPEWMSSFTSQGYVWDESAIAQARHASLHGGGGMEGDAFPHAQIVSFFISTSSRSPRTIAASIYPPSGSAPLAKTNDFGVQDPDGYGDGQGRFNSSVTVNPVDLGSLPIDAYTGTADGSLPGRPVGDTSNFYKIYEHAVGVRIRGRDVELRSVSSLPQSNSGFGVYQHGAINDATRWSISYYGQPGASTPEYFPPSPLHHLDIRTTATMAPATDAGHRGAVTITNVIDLGEDPSANDVVVRNEIRGGAGTSSRDQAPLGIYDPMTMFNDCGGTIVGASRYKLIIGLLAGHFDGSFLNASGATVADNPSDTFYLMDVYGNEHALVLAYQGNDALRLTLSKGLAKDGGTARLPDRRVDRLQVKVENAMVYRNDRQQALVSFHVELKPGEGPTLLTDEEKRSIRIIDYESLDHERYIPFSDEGSAERYRGWSAQRAHRGYDTSLENDAEGKKVPPVTPDEDGEYLQRYVSAHADASDAPLYLGMSITIAGVTYRSNGWRNDGGTWTYNSNLDTGKLGDLIVRSRVAERYPPSRFVLEGNEPPAAGRFDSTVRLSIGGSTAGGVRSMTCEPAGMALWAAAEALNPCCAGYASPGRTDVNWPQEMPASDLPREIDYAEKEKGAIVVCGRLGIPWDNDAPKGPMTVRMIDNHGSDQTCRLRFVAGKRGVLEII